MPPVMPIRGELSLRGELLLRELRLEAEAERMASHLAVDADELKPPQLGPMDSLKAYVPMELPSND